MLEKEFEEIIKISQKLGKIEAPSGKIEIVNNFIESNLLTEKEKENIKKTRSNLNEPLFTFLRVGTYLGTKLFLKGTFDIDLPPLLENGKDKKHYSIDDFLCKYYIIRGEKEEDLTILHLDNTTNSTHYKLTELKKDSKQLTGFRVLDNSFYEKENTIAKKGELKLKCGSKVKVLFIFSQEDVDGYIKKLSEALKTIKQLEEDKIVKIIKKIFNYNCSYFEVILSSNEYEIMKEKNIITGETILKSELDKINNFRKKFNTNDELKEYIIKTVLKIKNKSEKDLSIQNDELVKFLNKVI